MLAGVNQIDLSPLLEPLSVDLPCGEDLTESAVYVGLDRLAARTTGDAANWLALRDQCVQILKQSKDLQVGIYLCLALLKLDGLTGLAAGLNLVLGMLERFWDGLYPQSPDGDATARLGILASLAPPRGTFNDPLQFRRQVRSQPLLHVASHWLDTKGLQNLPEGVTEEEVKSAIVTEPEPVDQNLKAISDSLTALDAMGKVLSRYGVSRPSSLADLAGVLTEIKSSIAKYDERTPPAPEPIQQIDGERKPAIQVNGRMEHTMGAASLGSVQSRASAIQALEAVCAYLEQAEKSSPVPLLLRRAIRLLDMDFISVMKDLSPDSVKTLESVLGVSEPG